METLKKIGMNRGWIYEVIISTYHDSNPHSAPIGVWTDDFATLRMEIYKNTRTIKNIMTFREFAVNLVSDFSNFLGLFSHYLSGGLVFTQPGKNGLSHEALFGPAGEGDFADQLRLDPGDRSVGRRLYLKGALFLNQGL